MRTLKKGDLCPCCGRPIKTDNPDVLRLLGWIAEQRRLPLPDEIKQILNGEDPEVNHGKTV